MQNTREMKEKLQRLIEHAPEGMVCYPKKLRANTLSIIMMGPKCSPYEERLFELRLQMHDDYQFEPPLLYFKTQIYHPNIEQYNGIICMDILSKPPLGQWKPTISLENVLVAIKELLRNPNPDDRFQKDIAEEYCFNKKEFERKARLCAQQHGKHLGSC